MRRLLRTLVIVALVAGAIVAATRWPRINEVETGRTPEYPELRVRELAASEDTVGRAAKAAVAALPGWSFVGAGQGPGGTSIQAVATRPSALRTDMNITIRRQGGKTTVRVRARSDFGPWDFGQGARHIQSFLDELDRRLLEPGGAAPHPPTPRASPK
jgi:uncharacterized protein DUF1499